MERIEFTGAQGHTLAARLDRPAGTPKAWALFAHCFTCGKDIKAASRIAGALTRAGYAVLRFDFTGLGMSEGEFENTNFTSNVEDLIAAADFMRDAFTAPHLLIGHSLGGTAVIKAAGKIEEVRAVATIGAPFDAGHVAHHFGDKRSEIEEKGEAEIRLAGRPFTIKRQFLDDIENQTIKGTLQTLHKALLILHSPIDNIVGIDNAAAIFEAAMHPKSFISLDNADHLLSRAKDAEYAAATIAAWATRYLPETHGHDQDARTQNHETHVQSTGAGRFQQSVRTRSHILMSDEPEKTGGDNTGPDPYALLNAALGACTSMTIRMYADRKNLPLEGVEVFLDHEKIHADDCADCETQEGKIDRFTRRIVLHGGQLTREQRDRMIEIADKCPVHRTLEGEVKIKTEEKET